MRKSSVIMDVPAKQTRKKKSPEMKAVNTKTVEFDNAIHTATNALAAVLGVLDDAADIPIDHIRDQLDKLTAIQNSIVDCFEEDLHGT